MQKKSSQGALMTRSIHEKYAKRTKIESHPQTLLNPPGNFPITINPEIPLINTTNLDVDKAGIRLATPKPLVKVTGGNASQPPEKNIDLDVQLE